MDLERTEEQKEDEEVIDRKSFFNGIPGEVLTCGKMPERLIDDSRDEECRGDPDDGRDQCGGVGGPGCLLRSTICSSPGVEEFRREEEDQEEMEADPVGDRS